MYYLPATLRYIGAGAKKKKKKRVALTGTVVLPKKQRAREQIQSSD